jgi:hypothetical protein
MHPHGTQQRAPYAPASHGVGASPSDAAHWLVPLGRPWQSIVAGYVALFAIFIWPLGPVALGMGVWAIVRANRTRSHGRGRAIFAVVVGVPSTLLALVLLASALGG